MHKKLFFLMSLFILTATLLGCGDVNFAPGKAFMDPHATGNSE